MAVHNHGLDAIRKSANQIIPGDDREYYLATKLIDAIEGSFSPSGLSKDWRVTTLIVSDTAIPIPAIALSDRNSLIIHNKGSNKLYLGKADVTADTVLGTTSGWEIVSTSYYSLDVKDNIIIYGICEAGQSTTLKVLELA